MAVLKWGKPTIQIAELDPLTGKLPTAPKWKPIVTPKENTTKMTTEKGEKKEAKEEGGGIVDSKTGSSKYSLEFELFDKIGGTKPIEDFDGKISKGYAVRWLPEGDTTGWQMLNTSVSLEETYDAEGGAIWKYSFMALKPKVLPAKEGTEEAKMLQKYTK